MTTFTFRPEVREHVRALAELMMFANAQPGMAWPAQSSDPTRDGVYGLVAKALEKILEIECGSSVVRLIENSRHGFNFGGNATFLDDVETAVATALDEIAGEERAALAKQLEEHYKLTEASLRLFQWYAEDAPNWSGNPWLNGNRTFTKQDRGNLTQLKKAGLVTTGREPEFGEYLNFTDAGKAFAAALGCPIE